MEFTIDNPTFKRKLKLSSFNLPGSKSLDEIRRDLEEAFKTSAIQVLGDSKDFPKGLGFECETIRIGSLCKFNVHIHKDEEQESHTIEVFHIYGCRYAFYEVFGDLHDKMEIKSPKIRKTMYKPPPLPFTDQKLDEDPSTNLTSEFCSHIYSMLKNESQSVLSQSVRAAGQITTMVDSSYTPYYKTGGAGICIADRLLELVCDEYYIEYNSSNLPELLHAIANICELPDTCSEWLKRVIPICESYIGKEFHADNESKRALKAIYLRNL